MAAATVAAAPARATARTRPPRTPSAAARHGDGVHVEQGAVPVLRHRLPRPGRRAGRQGRRDRGRSEGRGEQGPALREGLPRRPRALRRGSPAPRRSCARTASSSPSRGTRRSTSSPSACMKNPAGFAIYGSGQWTIPEGYAANKFIKGGLGDQPDRRQRAALHVLGGDGLPRHLRRRRAGRLLRRPRHVRRAHHSGATTPPRCTRCCSRASSTGARAARRSPSSTSARAARAPAGSADHVLALQAARATSRSPAASRTCCVENGTYDKDFVEKHCAFRARRRAADARGQGHHLRRVQEGCSPSTRPEKVEQLSGVAGEGHPRCSPSCSAGATCASPACGAWA